MGLCVDIFTSDRNMRAAVNETGTERATHTSRMLMMIAIKRTPDSRQLQWCSCGIYYII